MEIEKKIRQVNGVMRYLVRTPRGLVLVDQDREDRLTACRALGSTATEKDERRALATVRQRLLQDRG